MRGEEEFWPQYLERKKMKHTKEGQENIRKEQWGMRVGDGESESERMRK